MLEYASAYNYSIRPSDGSRGVMATILVAADYPESNPPTYDAQNLVNTTLPMIRHTSPTHRECVPPTGSTCYRFDRLLVTATFPRDNITITTTACYTLTTLPYAETIRTWYYVIVSLVLGGLALFCIVMGVTTAVNRCREHLNASSGDVYWPIHESTDELATSV